MKTFDIKKVHEGKLFHTFINDKMKLLVTMNDKLFLNFLHTL